MGDFIQVMTTIDSREGASGISRRLLEQRLVACAHIAGPISSSYWWKGRIETAEEWYCIIKTTANRYDDVEREIRSIHPYEEPEIVAFPIVSGSRTYLDWLSGVVEHRE